MIFAARKLQGIGLIMLVTICFLLVYPIHLSVSATRAELRDVERQIAETRERNRKIEGDIAILSDVHQMDRWNAESFGYVPPSAEHYLPGERALANLDRLRPPANRSNSAPVLTALAQTPPRDTRTVDQDDPAPPPSPRSDSATRATIAELAVRDIARGTRPRATQDGQ